MATMVLAGAGWGDWRGAWRSDTVLRETAGFWSLETIGRRARTEADLESAVARLWAGRRVRDGRPWAVGWFGYEALAAHAGGLPARPQTGALPGGWLLVEPVRTGGVPAPATGGGPGAVAEFVADLDDAAFAAGVAGIRERIAAGDVYQVNLTRRFRLRRWRGGLGPLIEKAARGGEPPYLAWGEFPGGELACASMELLLRRRNRYLETRPIKGTRPRGASADEDDRLAAELASDAKELAELAMVVDLERNDLGRVAVPGTVRVDDTGSVHGYATVLHRVAVVRAEVEPSIPWWRLVAAVAPGGSVTGCPKRAAMAAIEELEASPRGPYCGALGVVCGNGNLELALPIRTAWRDGAGLTLATGCGIVWGSDPEREVAESRLKIAPWLALTGGGE